MPIMRFGWLFPYKPKRAIGGSGVPWAGKCDTYLYLRTTGCQGIITIWRITNSQSVVPPKK